MSSLFYFLPEYSQLVYNSRKKVGFSQLQLITEIIEAR